MTDSGVHIGQVATIVVPVTDQDAALAFYVEVLGMQKVNDFTYPTGSDGSRSRRRRAARTSAWSSAGPSGRQGSRRGCCCSALTSSPTWPPSARKDSPWTSTRCPRRMWCGGAGSAGRRPDAVPRARSRRQFLPHRRRALTPVLGDCSTPAALQVTSGTSGRRSGAAARPPRRGRASCVRASEPTSLRPGAGPRPHRRR